VTFLIILLVAIAPCAFWLWLIYKWDKYKPEPKWLIIRTFFYGLLVAIPVALIETLLYPNAAQASASLSSSAYLAFVVAGVTEELGKFLIVRETVYNSPHFEEPADGLVYAAAAALGFASLENAIYIFAFGWQVILVRALFSNLAHVLFSAMWGYALGLSKLGMLKKRWVWLGLVAAMTAHGFFDFLFFTLSAYTLLVIPLFLGLIVLFGIMMRWANRHPVYVAHRMLASKTSLPNRDGKTPP
jgi:RsiW-degrading membrane proteinase PrsW (M82 family)